MRRRRVERKRLDVQTEEGKDLMKEKDLKV